MPSSPELATRVVLGAAEAEATERALLALRAFEAERRAARLACKAAVVEAKRCYLETIAACGTGEHAFAASFQDCHSADQVVALLLEQDRDNAGWGEPFRTPAIAWRTRLLKRAYGLDVDALAADIGESIYAPSAHCRRSGERLLSAPFLARLTWLRRLERALPLPHGPFTVLELGGGYGALSRVFKLLHPAARMVLVDTPERLFHQQAFLRASFPDLAHHHVAGADDSTVDADFVYVPLPFAEALAPRDIFLAVHAESVGDRRPASSWLDLVQRGTKASHLFFLAPFLNRIGRGDLAKGGGDAGWSLGLGRHWHVRDWEVDPDHERCPYFQTTRPRRLQLVASRGDSVAAGEDAASLRARAEALRLEDWSVRPGHVDGRVATDAAYPPPRSRAELELTPDLGREGSLHALWSLARLVGDAESLAMLIAYLDHLNGRRSDVFFEELPMLAARHAALA